MIRYALVCEREHAFESWFRDSAAYDDLAASGRIACPACASVTVRKALMAPSVVSSRAKAAAPTIETAVAAPEPAAPQPVALIGERERTLRRMMRELHQRITESSDNVGREFPAEARRIHEGDAPPRSIYGEATQEQVAGLLEDGIPLLPMPPLPDDQN